MTDMSGNKNQFNKQENNMNQENNMEQENMSMSFEKWDEIDIHTKLLRGIYCYGFEEPSPIQKKSILPFIHKKDIIGQAQSGTGKTGAFTIGTLQNINVKQNNIQSIILCPTHELARQNKDVVDSIGKFLKVRTHILIGGSPVNEDREILENEKKPHVLIACPGRLYDVMRRGWIKPSHIKTFVIDEADEMLSSCFKEQVHNILQYFDNDIQIALFSATMPEDVKNLTEKFMRDPVKLFIQRDMLTLDGLKQYYIALNDDHQKYETLKDIFETLTLSQTIIYCNSVKRVRDLYDAMRQDQFPVISISSSMTQEERKESIQKFKSGEFRVLISSDVTARGIDIQQVSFVINFDLCKNIHTYLHRIGRSARWGRKGIAINFITPQDIKTMKEIEQHYSTQVEEMPKDFADHLG